jgi:predicted Zn finger-like uncharacterized protein
MLEKPAVDVRCERCQTEYELEDSSVSEEGTQVQCMACGNTFLVNRPAPGALVEPDSPPPAEWLLETSDGQAHRFRNLTSLQKWIIERKVTRQDRISRTGHAWRRLGEIVELEPFFDVVDEADKARAAAMSARAPALKNQAQDARRASSPGGSRTDELLRPVMGSAGNIPLEELDPERPEIETSVVRLGSGTAWKLLVVLGVAAVVAFVGITQFWKRPGMSLGSRPPIAPPPVVTPAPPPAPVVVPTPRPPEPTPPVHTPSAAPPPVVAGTPEARPDEAPVSYERLIADADRQLENGSSEKARALYERALKQKPGAAEALSGLGYVALDKGRVPQAFSLFKRALAQKPSLGSAIFGLAEAHRTTGDEEIALSHYRRYISVDPGGTDVQAARQHVKTLEARLAARGSAVSQPPPSPAP